MSETDRVVIDDIPLAGTLVESLPRVQLALSEWEEHRRRHIASIHLEVIGANNEVPMIRITATTEDAAPNDGDVI